MEGVFNRTMTLRSILNIEHNHKKLRVTDRTVTLTWDENDNHDTYHFPDIAHEFDNSIITTEAKSSEAKLDW